MRFKDIPQFTNWGHYAVDVHLRYVPETLVEYREGYDLDTNPDFQRAHVWDNAQRTAYVEFLLRGGRSGRDIFFNCPGFNGAGETGRMVLVDGKQRLEAVSRFFGGTLEVFGRYFGEYEDRLRQINTLRFWVNDLETRGEVLAWYLEMNAGGTPHTPEELESRPTEQQPPQPAAAPPLSGTARRVRVEVMPGSGRKGEPEDGCALTVCLNLEVDNGIPATRSQRRSCLEALPWYDELRWPHR